jgi:hypothetical protein
MSVVPEIKGETDCKAELEEEMTRRETVDLRPKFLEKEVVASLERFEDEVADIPIEFYEARLYELTAQYVLQLDVATISLKIIDEMHHIIRLKSMELAMDTSEVDTLNRNLEKLLNRRPQALIEYRFLVSMIELIEALTIKWSIFRLDNYNYRLRGRALNVTILDIEKTNERVFSMDTIFLSRVLREQPFSQFVDELTHQYGIVLHQELVKLINFMLRLNNADFEEVPSISGYLAYINPELYRKKFVVPDPYATEPVYQDFKLPKGFINRCFGSKTELKALKLFKMVKDFELVYRTFEKALVTLVLTIPNKIL